MYVQPVPGLDAPAQRVSNETGRRAEPARIGGAVHRKLLIEVTERIAGLDADLAFGVSLGLVNLGERLEGRARPCLFGGDGLRDVEHHAVAVVRVVRDGDDIPARTRIEADGLQRRP